MPPPIASGRRGVATSQLSLRRVREHRQLIRPLGQRRPVTTTRRGPRARSSAAAAQRVRQRLDPQSREVRELEAVGHDDVGKRGQALRDRLGDAGADEHAGPSSPITGIAQIRRSRARGTDRRDRTRDHVGHARIAEIAAEHGRAAREHAALLEAARISSSCSGCSLCPRQAP